MISVNDALLLIGFGGGFMLTGIVAGAVLDMRWLNRRLSPKKKVTQVTKGTP